MVFGRALSYNIVIKCEFCKSYYNTKNRYYIVELLCTHCSHPYYINMHHMLVKLLNINNLQFFCNIYELINKINIANVMNNITIYEFLIWF